MRQKENYNIQGKNLKLRKKKNRIDKGKKDKLEELLFHWFKQNTASAVASAWTCVPQSALTKAWKNLIGQPSLSDVNADQFMEITTILNNIHGSNTYSLSDVQEWTNEDCQLPICHNISDRELVSQFLGSTNVEVTIWRISTKQKIWKNSLHV